MNWKHFAEIHRCCSSPCASEGLSSITQAHPHPQRIFITVTIHYLSSLLIMTTYYLASLGNSYSSFDAHKCHLFCAAFHGFPGSASCSVLCFHRAWCRCSDSYVLHCPIKSWFGVSFSTPWLWVQRTQLLVYVCMCTLSGVHLCAAPLTVACQAPLFMKFPRQEYWGGLPFPTPGDPPDPGIEPASLASPALAGRFFTTGTIWEALRWLLEVLSVIPAQVWKPTQGQAHGRSEIYPSMLSWTEGLVIHRRQEIIWEIQKGLSDPLEALIQK